MFNLSNITKKYTTSYGPVTALNDVSLEISDAGLFFILGASGSGKSTLLHLLGGMISDYSGSYLLDETDTADFTDEDWDSFRNLKIGFVFQDYNLIEDESVEDNVMLPLQIRDDHDKDEKRLADILEKVGLSGYSTRLVKELSGGQKQRVAIARALIKDPELILADEPTGNLDSMTSEEVFELLAEIARDRCVCVVSHNKEAAEKYADRIIFIKNGEIEKITENDRSLRYDIAFEQDGKTEVFTGCPRQSVEEKIRSGIDSVNSMSGKLNISITAIKTLKAERQAKIRQNRGKACPLSVKNAFSLSLHNQRQRKGRSVVYSVILLLVIFLNILLGTLLTCSQSDTLAAYYDKYHQPYLQLEKRIAYVDKYFEEQEGLLKIGPVFLGDLHDRTEHLLPVLNGSELYKDVNNYEFTDVKSVVVSDRSDLGSLEFDGYIPVEDNEIMLTDYLSYRLTESEDAVGVSVTFDGNDMTVCGILHTDYKEYDILNKISSNRVSEYAIDKIRNQYEVCVLGKEYIEAQKNKDMITVKRADISCFDWESRYIESEPMLSFCTGREELLSGQSPDSENEVLISPYMAAYFDDMGIEYMEQTLILPDLYDKSNCSYYTDGINLFDHFPNGVKITGVFDISCYDVDHFPDMLLLPDVFRSIVDEYYEKFVYSEYFLLGGEHVDSGLFDSLRDKNIYWNDISAYKIYNFFDALDSLEVYLLLLLAVCALLELFIPVVLINYNIKNDNKKIGILKALGFSSGDLKRIYMWETAGIAAFSIIGSNILLAAGMLFANSNYAKALKEFAFDLFIPKLWVILLFDIMIFLMCVAFAYIPIKKMTRTPPYDLIHNLIE